MTIGNIRAVSRLSQRPFPVPGHPTPFRLFVEAVVLATIATVVGLAAADSVVRWVFAYVGGQDELPFWILPGLKFTTVLYAAPFLSYGIASLLMAGRPMWVEVRASLLGTFVFAASVLLASGLHRNLFSFTENSDRLWFFSFGLATLVLGVLSLQALTARSQGA